MSIIFAIDGPAAAGKGTLAKRLEDHFKLSKLDTGLLYRATGFKVVAGGGDPEDAEVAEAAARALDPAELDNPALRTDEAAQAASKVSAVPGVRAALLDFQRNFAGNPPLLSDGTPAKGAILDGRDIGTVVCPEADVKLFIKADSKARMERRARQFEARGQPVDRYALYHQIEERDARDRANPNGAFYPAADAHLLDTTRLDIEAALRAAIAIVDEAIARKAGRYSS